MIKFAIVGNKSKSGSPIQQLKNLQGSYSIKVEALEVPKHFFKVAFYISNLKWELYIDDEYEEFSINDLVKIYLVLCALEDYEEARDYLHWCTIQMLTPEEKWAQYYKYLGQAYQEIQGAMGAVDSFFNPLDYQLKSGDYYKLLQLKN